MGKTIKASRKPKKVSVATAIIEQPQAFVDEIVAGSAYDYQVPAFVEEWIAELEAAGKAKAEAAAAKPANQTLEKGKIQVVSKAMIAAAEAGAPVVSISADLQDSTGVALSAPVPSSALKWVLPSRHGEHADFQRWATFPWLIPRTVRSHAWRPEPGSIIAVFSHIGFQDAADGVQGLCHLAMAGSIPHVQVYSPASAREAGGLWVKRSQFIESQKQVRP